MKFVEVAPIREYYKNVISNLLSLQVHCGCALSWIRTAVARISSTGKPCWRNGHSLTCAHRKTLTSGHSHCLDRMEWVIMLSVQHWKSFVCLVLNKKMKLSSFYDWILWSIVTLLLSVESEEKYAWINLKNCTSSSRLQHRIPVPLLRLYQTMRLFSDLIIHMWTLQSF